MAIAVVFAPVSMDARQYDDIIRRLDQAGAGAPPGRLHHVCFGEGSRLRVLDVWESPEAFQRFGETLVPIINAVGVDPGHPEVVPIHSAIAG